MRKVLCVPECIGLIGNINARTSQALSHCPHIAPRQSPGQSGCYRDAITRRQYAQAQPSDDPPFTWLAKAGDHIGYWKCSASGGSRHPQMLWNLLAFFLIFWKYPRISLSLEYPGTNSFPRHDITWLCYQNITPYIWSPPAPTQDNKADGEHFGACTRRRDLN